MRVAVLVLLVASTMFAGAKRLGDTARLARDLSSLPDLETRRARYFGKWYVAIEQVKKATPPNATIDFVMARPEARDIAVLGAAELQPRDVRLFDGMDAWKSRTRAVLLHDDRAANAVPGPPPSAAQYVFIVDPRVEPAVRELRR